MNGPTHRAAAALAIGGFLAWKETQTSQQIAKPLIGAALAALATNLPDLLEPSNHPNHRQVFHSLAFAALLGRAVVELNAWQAETDFEKGLRFTLLVIVNAYLVHLALDFVTPNSLPLFGNLS
jgi:membrane-bound metal-dependent hydrolase YbcI (DUF457 family)